jgi:ATP-dependent RNA helicase DeaD
VHRIGRTGRAGKSGMAISIVTPSEFKALSRIQKGTKSPIKISEIPTINDVKGKKFDSLYMQIKNQEIKDGVFDLIERLKEEFDLTTISFKLASVVMEKSAVSGADEIGKSIKEIKRLIEKDKKTPQNSSRQRRGYRNNRSRNNNRRDKNRY